MKTGNLLKYAFNISRRRLYSTALEVNETSVERKLC